MVKDAKGRFLGNDLWGDGWGWALFLAKEPALNVATDYTTDCKTCHVPARKDDWIYVRGYPVLAKPAPAKSPGRSREFTPEPAITGGRGESTTAEIIPVFETGWAWRSSTSRSLRSCPPGGTRPTGRPTGRLRPSTPWPS